MTSNKKLPKEELTKGRPLSPHLQIYKPQITSLTSIFHRATGMFLYFGIVIICWAMVYYTYKPDILMDEAMAEDCHCFWKDILEYVIYLAVIGFIFSLYYHLFNGIRHLLWDMGKGYQIKTARKTGFLVLISALLMTIISVILFV